MQKETIVEVLLNSKVTELVISLEFVKKKQQFRLKKIKKPIYIRNINRTFNKKESIENTVKVDIYYQRHKEKIVINIIREQKCSIILEML